MNIIQISLCIITNDAGEILLQHRDSKAPTNPNKWGLWGGRVEGEETPIQGMIREVHEELMITTEASDYIPFKVFSPEFMRAHGVPRDIEMHVFQLKHKPEYEYDQHEGDYMKWFLLEECSILEDMCPVTQPLLQEFLIYTLRREAFERFKEPGQ